MRVTQKISLERLRQPIKPEKNEKTPFVYERPFELFFLWVNGIFPYSQKKTNNVKTVA